MKLILSVSKRILKQLNIDEIFELIDTNDKNKFIDGIEIMTNKYDSLEEVAMSCKERGLIFQCHSPKFLDIEELYKYLMEVDKISTKINKKINIVFHSLELENIEKSIEKTKIYIEKIIKFKNDNKLKLEISLENLNYIHEIKRINVDNIDKVLSSDVELKYTYDMGHDIFDNKDITEMTKLQKEKVNNVHIHWYINDEDHHPILLENMNIEIITSGFEMLKSINYNKSIVLEYGIDFLKGNTYESKMIEYIKSFEIVKKIIDEI